MDSLVLKCFLLLLLSQVGQVCFAQESDMTREVLLLINESRTNPTGFLHSYREDIEQLEPKYIPILERAEPVPEIIWDEALAAMAKEAIDKDKLNPAYSGNNELCGQTSGFIKGSILKFPMKYVCDVYTNINNQDYKYLGIYFNNEMTGFGYEWGVTCDRKKIEYKYSEAIDTSIVNYHSIKTARFSDYLSDVEQSMIEEINLVRAYPKVYAQIIARYLSQESQRKDGLNKDTYDAGMELMDELSKMIPVSILKPRACIYVAAQKHGTDCQERGFINHIGSDESHPWDRILEECTELSYGNENLAGNGYKNPRETVIALLLDSGISSRGHRYNLLDQQWQYVACYRYTHPEKPYMFYWVQNFAF